jgi:hypothetical protein
MPAQIKLNIIARETISISTSISNFNKQIVCSHELNITEIRIISNKKSAALNFITLYFTFYRNPCRRRRRLSRLGRCHKAAPKNISCVIAALFPLTDAASLPHF